MAVKHRIVINISDCRRAQEKRAEGRGCETAGKVLKFLFGEFTQVYLLSPGQTVESVDIREVEEGGEKHVKDE